MNDELSDYVQVLRAQADALGMESLTEEQQCIVMGECHLERICAEGEQLTHQEAAAVYKQLLRHPEICDDCDIKPCVFAEYMYGKLTSASENEEGTI